MANTNLKMTVTADAKQAEDSLSSLVSKLKDTASKAAKVGATIAVVTTAVKELISAAKECVSLAQPEMLAAEQLKSVMSALGSSVTTTYGKMINLADSISDLTGIEEQQIYAAERVLLSFNSLNSEGLERTLQLSADVAMAMGTDISSAAQKLGQVLATPTQGLDGLKEIGIVFTSQEQEQIKTVYAANGAYEAQALILDKVEKAYGRAASTVGNSTANLLTKINETWTDIKTDLGKGLLDTLTPALDILYKTLLKISKWTKSAMGLNTEAEDSELSASGAAPKNTTTSASTDGSSVITNFLSSHGSDSKTYQLAQYQAVIDEAKMYLDILPSRTEQEKEVHRYLNEIVQTTEAKIEALKTGVEGVTEAEEELEKAEGEIPEDTTIKDILSSLGSYSESYQTDQLAEQINNVKAALDSLADGDPAKTYLQEIYDAMTAVEEESYSLKDALTDIGSALLDTFSSVATSLAEIWTNQADALEASMKEQEEAGELTVAEKEKMQEEIDELNRKAFETNKANSMADATISLANTIIGIIEQCKGNPVAIAALSALATASWGAQVASIGSQQYTAMATGGIVTGPTHALIGEAGPEAIIPLKDKRAQEYLGSGANPVQINITIEGNADEEVVFNAIERAQKTGMLPSWRYAN